MSEGKIDKQQAAQIFSEIAILLELNGENAFRIRSFTNTARQLRGLEGDLGEMLATGEIAKVSGIGKGTVERLKEIAKTGTLAEYETLKQAFPAGLTEMLKVPGLGAKKVRALYEHLQVGSLGELEYACRENRLLALEGFGVKTQENILKGIEHVRRFQGRFLISTARRVAVQLLSELRGLAEVEMAEVGGSLRRWKETVKDVDLVAATSESAKVMEWFVSHPWVTSVVGHGPTKSSVVLGNGLQVDLRTVSREQYPYALMHFTGSKEHNTVMRSRAKDRGMKLNEYGLFRGDDLVICEDEAAIYRALDLHFIPPEMREDHGEFEKAASVLPTLVTQTALRGVFHAHTVESDGSARLEEMAEACRAQGWSYLGVTDHSQSAHYANGLTVERVLRQHQEADALNQKWSDFVILKGIESDILADGSLDYADEILAHFDFVIASVHSQFKMTEEAMTARIIRAIEHPATTMLGHPTGRLLLSREGYSLDMAKIIDAAIANGVIIEINANPYRLDIDWRFLERACARGLLVSINPDAHSIEGLEDVIYGVGIARKGGLEPASVFNTWPLEEVRRWLSARKKN